MGKDAEYISREKKFRLDWETLCLQALGQKKYNETRKLPKTHKGVTPYVYPQYER